MPVNVLKARLNSLRKNLPTGDVEESVVNDFNAMVDALEKELPDLAVSHFRVPDADVKQIWRKRPNKGMVLSSDKYCDPRKFKIQVEGLWEYLGDSGVIKSEDSHSHSQDIHIHAPVTGSVIQQGIRNNASVNAQPALHPASVSDEYKFVRLAVEEARKSVAEDDSKPHPMVGAVVVKDGQVLSVAHRGEVPGNHAEFTALERKLADSVVAGATVYTTLEPCTTRSHPKIPCAERLIERKVARVVIGMLDPDPRITGRGQRRLRDANIITDFFPHDLMTELEELNRDFTRQFKGEKPNESAMPNFKFERRIKVYNATREFIRFVVSEADVKSIEPLFKLMRETEDNHLFFGPEIGKYIDELYLKGKRLHSIWLAAGPTHVMRPEHIAEDTEIQQWFTQQIEFVRYLFLKYLDFREAC